MGISLYLRLWDKAVLLFLWVRMWAATKMQTGGFLIDYQK